MIYMGIEMIANFQNWEKGYIGPKQLFGGIAMIIIASIYLIVDIIIIIKELIKSRKKSN